MTCPALFSLHPKHKRSMSMEQLGTAQGATLMAHVDTNQVTREQLGLIPTPPATETFTPVPHIELVTTLEGILEYKGITVTKEQYAVRSDGSKFFGAFDLSLEGVLGTCGALAFRNGNNRLMKLQMVTGGKVFVCDNMCLTGDTIVLSRKHTAKLDLLTELYLAVDKFIARYEQFKAEILALSTLTLTQADAKAFIYDAFSYQIMPKQFMFDVGNEYFNGEHGFQPGNAWALHNAFTYVMKGMFLNKRMEATQRLGKMFNLLGDSSKEEQVIDAEVDEPSEGEAS
jgi:hypothetical protein